MSRVKRPLNMAAASAADEAMYDKYKDKPRPNELYSADGTRKKLSGTDPKQEDLRREWIALYAANGGELEGPPPAPKPCDDPTLPCPCKPIASINIISVEYLSDHKLLKKYDADWKDGGSRYPKPEWTPGAQHPISHTMDKPMEITVKFEVVPPDACPETGDLLGEGPDGLIFKKPAYNFTPGIHTVSLKSDRNLAKKVQALDFRIQWKAQGVSASFSPSVTANKMYVTYDTPYNDTPYSNEVTEKRLSWVCTLCSGDSNGHDSVKKIHDSTGSYDLSASTPAPHWNIAGGVSAQCMDLSKFYMLGTEMLGLRTGEVVYLYPKVGKTTKESGSASAVERRSVEASAPSHSAASPHKTINPNEEILLVDFSGGWNNYEACYKFTHPDTSGALTTRYYAGGAGIYDTAQEVMEAVCKETHWTFESSPGSWSMCATPGPSPVDKWSP